MKKSYLMVVFLFCSTFIFAQQITTIAGNGKTGFSGDGEKATSARLNLPFNLTFDKNQNLYIADTYNNSIRKINAETGIISTIIRNEDKFAVDALKTPTGVTFDQYDNLYIAELSNLRIRKVNVNSGKAITLVGTKSEKEQPNINADLAGPFNVVFDKSGNLYVSVNGDSSVRKVDFATGEISDIAGTGEAGFSGDGKLAKNAQLSNPTGLALDTKGNLYISDTGNERIRKVDLNSGIISTIAGNGDNGFLGDGKLAKDARLSNPLGLVTDRNNDLYIVDRGNNRIRKIEFTTGIISTIAGTGKAGFSGDGGLATEAELQNPTGLAFDKDDNLYVVDRGNNRIRKITGLVENKNNDSVDLTASVSVYPNPSTDKISIELKNGLELKQALLFDVTGKQTQVELNNKSINVSRLPRGIYILRLITSNGSLEQKIVLE